MPMAAMHRKDSETHRLYLKKITAPTRPMAATTMLMPANTPIFLVLLAHRLHG
ncbi:Uncharacterised protein [Serratia ficaria]|nr:Uncharacterised protein [Serratia ficaria]